MSKNTCEASRPLSISKLKKMKFLQGFCNGYLTWDSGLSKSRIGIAICIWDRFPRVHLTYSVEGERVEYDIDITSTPCNYGGKRFWFVCPASRDGIACRRRVGVLYAAGTYFACRKCNNLAYQSQQESRYRPLGIFGDFLRLSDKFDAKERAIRTKYWKGQPTKRYAKFLRKAGKIPTLEQLTNYRP